MDAISYTYVRNNFAGTMEKVCNDHMPVIITRKNAEAVIMMSLDDYNAMVETTYLLRSPKNSSRLTQSIKELESKNLIKKENSDFE